MPVEIEERKARRRGAGVEAVSGDGGAPTSRRRARWAATFWLLGIGVASATASTRWGVARLQWVNSLPGRDKTGHFVLMGGFAFFAVLAFAGARWGRRRVSVSAVLAVVVALVAAEELLQRWLPLRSFSLEDFAWSLAGVFCFGGAAVGWERRARKRSPRR